VPRRDAPAGQDLHAARADRERVDRIDDQAIRDFLAGTTRRPNAPVERARCARRSARGDSHGWCQRTLSTTSDATFGARCRYYKEEIAPMISRFQPRTFTSPQTDLRRRQCRSVGRWGRLVRLLRTLHVQRPSRFRATPIADHDRTRLPSRPPSDRCCAERPSHPNVDVMQNGNVFTVNGLALTITENGTASKHRRQP